MLLASTAASTSTSSPRSRWGVLGWSPPNDPATRSQRSSPAMVVAADGPPMSGTMRERAPEGRSEWRCSRTKSRPLIANSQGAGDAHDTRSSRAPAVDQHQDASSMMLGSTVCAAGPVLSVGNGVHQSARSGRSPPPCRRGDVLQHGIPAIPCFRAVGGGAPREGACAGCAATWLKEHRQQV